LSRSQRSRNKAAVKSLGEGWIISRLRGIK
jgi:hypothetical protein